MDETFCNDGKRKTEVSYTVTFKAEEVEQVFIHGFAMIYSTLKDERLLTMFQNSEKVVKDSLDEVVKILPSPDELYTLKLFICRSTKSVRFEMRINALFAYVPIEFGNNYTRNKCIDIANVIKSMREANELPEPGKDQPFTHHSP
jgi:hypothetical protein